MSLIGSGRARAALVCYVVCLFAALSAPARPRVTRALWLWGEATPEAADWAANAGFNTLLLEIPDSRIGTPSTRALVRASRASGLRVWAMSGRPEWARSTAAIRKWARRVRKTRGIAGVLVDVEPYLLDEWDTARSRTVSRYLRALRAAKRAAAPLPLMVAVPFWFDHDSYRDARGTLAAKIADIADEVAVMAYRDKAGGADGIITLSRGEVDIASRTGTSALVTVQTAPDELDKLSFHEEGPAALRVALAETLAAFDGHPGFGGVAVHHYSAYREFVGRRSEGNPGEN